MAYIDFNFSWFVLFLIRKTEANGLQQGRAHGMMFASRISLEEGKDKSEY